MNYFDKILNRKIKNENNYNTFLNINVVNKFDDSDVKLLNILDYLQTIRILNFSIIFVIYISKFFPFTILV